jgi:hypothetical protein
MRFVQMAKNIRNNDKVRRVMLEMLHHSLYRTMLQIHKDNPLCFQLHGPNPELVKQTARQYLISVDRIKPLYAKSFQVEPSDFQDQ